MRKSLSIFILAFLLFGIGATIGSSVSAQPLKIDEETVVGAEKKPHCCKLKHSITGWSAGAGITYSTGEWVGTGALLIPPTVESFGELFSKICPIYPSAADQTSLPSDFHPDPNWAGFCTLDAIASVGDIVKYAAMIAVGVALLVAAVMFIMAAGSTERVSKAKRILLYSLIGVLIATLAHFLPGLVRFFLGI